MIFVFFINVLYMTLYKQNTNAFHVVQIIVRCSIASNSFIRWCEFSLLGEMGVGGFLNHSELTFSLADSAYSSAHLPLTHLKVLLLGEKKI